MKETELLKALPSDVELKHVHLGRGNNVLRALGYKGKEAIVWTAQGEAYTRSYDRAADMPTDLDGVFKDFGAKVFVSGWFFLRWPQYDLKVEREEAKQGSLF